MTTDEKQESDRKLLRLRIALGIAIVALLGWIGFSLFESNLRAARSEANEQVAKSNSQTLAEDIKAICTQQGKLLLDDRDLCAKAEAVQATPTEAIAGAKGDKGNPGATGPMGPLGPVGPKGDQGPLGPLGPKGDKGDQGVEGVDATSVGPAGAPGAAGPMGPPGPAGADGAPGSAGPAGADGAPGATGAQGESGRGVQSAYCGDDAHWLVTYTDGATSDGGVCRTEPGPPIGVLP